MLKTREETLHFVLLPMGEALQRSKYSSKQMQILTVLQTIRWVPMEKATLRTIGEWELTETASPYHLCMRRPVEEVEQGQVLQRYKISLILVTCSWRLAATQMPESQRVGLLFSIGQVLWTPNGLPSSSVLC